MFYVELNITNGWSSGTVRVYARKIGRFPLIEIPGTDDGHHRYETPIWSGRLFALHGGDNGEQQFGICVP
jgi:hypothetical protein